MATRYSFELKDESGQLIQMEEAVQGRQAEVYKFECGVKIAVDTATSKVTGIREYQPVKICKAICKASPIIFQKLCEGKKLHSATLKCYRHDPDKGDERHFYSLNFQDVSIVQQRHIGPDVNADDQRFLPPLEEIELIAEKVAATFVEGHISWQDEYRRKDSKSKALNLLDNF